MPIRVSNTESLHKWTKLYRTENGFTIVQHAPNPLSIRIRANFWELPTKSELNDRESSSTSRMSIGVCGAHFRKIRSPRKKMACGAVPDNVDNLTDTARDRYLYLLKTPRRHGIFPPEIGEAA